MQSQNFHDTVASRSGFIVPTFLDLCAQVSKHIISEHPQFHMSISELMDYIFSITLQKLMHMNHLPPEIIQESNFKILLKTLDTIGVQNIEFAHHFEIAMLETAGELHKLILQSQ